MARHRMCSSIFLFFPDCFKQQNSTKKILNTLNLNSQNEFMINMALLEYLD